MGENLLSKVGIYVALVGVSFGCLGASGCFNRGYTPEQEKYRMWEDAERHRRTSSPSDPGSSNLIGGRILI